MPAGIGAGGAVNLMFEATVGTYLDPSTAGSLWCPIVEESLEYTEDKYISRQIRNQAVAVDAKSSYYHVEGDITVEVDPNTFPYWMHGSRHTVAKTGAGPFTYTYTPNSGGSTTTAASGNVRRTLSITVIRNGIGFGYAGCTVSRIEPTIEDGVLRCTFGIVGVSEVTPAALGTQAWVDPLLYGGECHSVFVAAAAVTPTWGSAVTDFNGYTLTIDHNAEAQARIRPDRSASFVKFGETEITYDTELDFVSKTEYDNFKATTFRAVKLSSLHGTPDLTGATDGVEFEVNRSAYESYGVDLGSMPDLVSASVTGRGVGIAGGDAYKIKVKSAAAIV